MTDSAFIIEIMTTDEEQFQVFAKDKFQMMSVLKKILATDHYIISVNATGNILTGDDFLKIDNDSDLNFG